MSGSFDTPSDIGTELAEINRRLRVLETAARVPQVSTVDQGPSAGTELGSSVVIETPGYVDPGSPTGPSVAVTVSQTGRLLVIWSFEAELQADAGETTFVACSPDLSGANTVPASDDRSVFVRYSATSFSAIRTSATRAAMFTGLAPGSTTVTLKYQGDFLGVSNAATVLRRTVVALPL